MKKISLIIVCVLVCMILASYFYPLLSIGSFRGEIFYPLFAFSISVCLLTWDILFKRHCRKEKREVTLLGHDYPESLKTYNGIGRTMLGNFSYANGVSVSYCIYVFLGIIVWIKGCYFCTKSGSTYSFYAEINGKPLEIFYLFSIAPAILATIVSILAVIANVFSY